MSAGVLGIATVLLVACTSGGNNVQRGLPSTQNGVVERVLNPNPQGETLGQGPVRVALLAPITIPGGAALVAAELKNGASMAMQDFGQNNLQLVIKDTKGQAAAAQNAAGEAVSEGASMIVGPLFAANVSAASAMTLPSRIPMLAFSTDTTVAKRNVYLFSYTPQADTARILKYAADTGKRSIAAFLPVNAEGLLREKVARELSGSRGMQIAVFKYERSGDAVEKAIAQAALSVQAADTIYIPEGGPIPNVVLSGLRRNGVDLTGKQVLGSGNWESVKTDDPLVQGAVYPGRDISAFNSFATRYQSLYGTQPGVQAALAYDAVTLASEMARINGKSNPFPQSGLESRNGFRGINGAFRIKPDGTTERGLALYRVINKQGTLLEPAAAGFSAY